MTQIFFITEVLQIFLKKENSPNSSFYQLIEELILIFDKKQENYSEFHLFILIQLFSSVLNDESKIIANIKAKKRRLLIFISGRLFLSNLGFYQGNVKDVYKHLVINQSFD